MKCCPATLKFADFQEEKSWRAFWTKGRSFTFSERKRKPILGTLGKDFCPWVGLPGRYYWPYERDKSFSLRSWSHRYGCYLKIKVLLAKLLIWKTRVEADILADFQMLEELFTKMELRNKIVNFFEKINLRTPGNNVRTLSKVICLDDIKVSFWYKLCRRFWSSQRWTQWS